MVVSGFQYVKERMQGRLRQRSLRPLRSGAKVGAKKEGACPRYDVQSRDFASAPGRPRGGGVRAGARLLQSEWPSMFKRGGVNRNVRRRVCGDSNKG